MQTSELRSKILDECPEGFYEELESWINDMEDLLSDALRNFEIDGVGDLHKIEDAKKSIEEIHDGLY